MIIPIKIWIKTNKYGLLGSLAFHMLLLIILLIFKINTNRTQQTTHLVIEYIEEVSEIKPKSETKKEKEQSETKKIKNTESLKDILKSIAVNTSDRNNKSAQESIDQMISEIKNEIHMGSDEDIVTSVGEKKNKKEKKKPEERKKEGRKKNKNTYYNGPSSVNYQLVGRNKIYLPIPVFKCQGEGIIAVEIKVNNQGEVLRCKIINNESNTQDKCLVKAALQAAKESQFNNIVSDKNIQIGRISYTFIKQ